MVRLSSSSRCSSSSTAARRKKIEIVAVLDLGEEQAVLTADFAAFRSVKKGVNTASHFWPHCSRSRAVRESANSCSRSGSEHRRKALVHCWKSIPLLAHANGQPIMLVQADPSRERKIRTHAHEHGTPVLVVQIEVILIDPSLFEFQMRVIVVLPSDRHQNTGWFSCLSR